MSRIREKGLTDNSLASSWDGTGEYQLLIGMVLV